MDFGLAIKKLRKAEGLTQGELAEKVGVTKNWISEIENGANTSTDLIKKVFKVFDVPESFLIFLGSSIDDIPEDRRALYNILAVALEEFILELVKERSNEKN